MYLKASDLREAQELLEQYRDIIYGQSAKEGPAKRDKKDQAKLAEPDSAKKLFCPYCHID